MGPEYGAILIKFEKVVPNKLKLKTVKTNRSDDTLPLLNYENANLPTSKTTRMQTCPPKLYPILHLPS